MDPKKASEIKEYVKTATFSEIMGSKQHRRNTEQLTYQTTSKKLCYWCLTASCLVKRGSSLPQYKSLPRVELDGITISMCAAYREKLEAQVKETIEKTQVQEQVAST